ncbi:MAG: sugar phosphate isomerase/epimerase [Gemmatimonadetes bacterium]|nr:sugar phosphate isomerase/epimerase [Gemmatimonadota bacterium]MYB55781.1 sugar phosphate isomerase/epimerase [Gemmatimonadota bacterium]
MPHTMIAAQMYTVRDFTKTISDIVESVKKVKAIGYDAMQVSGFGPIDPAELKKIADDNDIEICATHTGFDRMRDDTQAVIDEHHLWNCKYPAIGSLPASYREDGEAGYIRFAKDASEVGHKLADAGLTFAYHNHNFEFQKFGNRTALEIILQETDPKAVQLEIDVYWVQAGGGDPAEWIRKANTRIDLVHVKDMAIEGRETRFAEVGEGNLNWPAIFEAGRESGTRWYIVEQDRCYDRDPFDSLKISYDNLRAMGLS